MATIAETLFCIFYQNPRDLLQEQAAQELTARDWRWHKVLRQWLQKDAHSGASNPNSAGGSAGGGAGAAGGAGGGNSSLPILDLTNGAPVGVPPQRVSQGVERGVYVFFDVMNWRRERREFVLAYDELDHRFTTAMGMIGAAGGPAGGGGGGGAGTAMGMGVGAGMSVGMGMGMGGPVMPPVRDVGVMSGAS